MTNDETAARLTVGNYMARKECPPGLSVDDAMIFLASRLLKYSKRGVVAATAQALIWAEGDL